MKRTSAISMGVVMVWMCLAGGYGLLRPGDTFGWLALVFGVGLLAVPFTSYFRSYWANPEPARVVPALVLTGNIVLLVLYGGIAWAYLQDPFLTYNDLNTLAGIVFGVATGLSLHALAVNVVALQLDRRSR